MALRAFGLGHIPSRCQQAWLAMAECCGVGPIGPTYSKKGEVTVLACLLV
jgi:hypothetical protein